MMKIRGYGKEYTVEAKKGMYQNGNLCIQLLCLNEEFGYMEPYAKLTVNLQDGLASDLAYVDTNNVPGAEDFINTYGLGVNTGVTRRSGYCTYPLYRFYTDVIEDM